MCRLSQILYHLETEANLGDRITDCETEKFRLLIMFTGLGIKSRDT